MAEHPPQMAANTTDKPPMIFDPARQRAKFARSIARGKMENSAEPFLWDHIAADIAERLSLVTRDFTDILLIGPAGEYAPILLGNREGRVKRAYFAQDAIAGDSSDSIIEREMLPFSAEDFDLVICFGVLDHINDLPGFMFQLRHILRPDGLFLGSAFGAGTLSTLKKALIMAEDEEVMPHIHPQIDLDNMSQLVTRAGFAMPVIDQDNLKVRYSSLNALLADLRNMGLGNSLSGPRRYFGRDKFRKLHNIWHDRSAQDGKTTEQFNFLHINGWAPSPDQPKPAKRGSGQKSLADILGKDK